MDLPLPGVPSFNPLGQRARFSVQHNHVAGLGVDAVIHGVAALKKLLRHERDEHGHAGSGKGTLDFDVAGPQRQAGHKALFLLVVQPDKGIVVFLRHARGPEDFVLQLLRVSAVFSTRKVIWNIRSLRLCRVFKSSLASCP